MQRRLKQNDGFYTQNRSRVAEEAGLAPSVGPRHGPRRRIQNRSCFSKLKITAVENQCVFPRSWQKYWISLEVLGEMQRRLKQNDGFYTQNRSRVAEEAGKGDKGTAKLQKQLCFLMFLLD